MTAVPFVTVGMLVLAAFAAGVLLGAVMIKAGGERDLELLCERVARERGGE